METINSLLSEFLNIIGGNNNIVPKEVKINKLIDQITGDGNKKIIEDKKKIISIKTIELTENNKVELENPIEFKNYLLKLKKTSNVHEFFSSSEEF